jgi:hypothetical protein
MKSEIKSALSTPGPVRMSAANPSTFGVYNDRTIIRRERLNE